VSIATLARLFTIFAGFAFLQAANTVSFIQGGPALKQVLSDNRAIAAFYGVFVCGVPLILSIIIAAVIARRSATSDRWNRLPLFWLTERDHAPLDRSSWEMRAYLLAGVLLFILSPIYGIGHMLDTVFEDGRIRNRSLARDVQITPISALPLVGSNWSTSVMTTPNADGAIRLRYVAPTQDSTKSSEVDWFKYATPAWFFVICIGISGGFYWFFWEIIKK